MANEYTNYPPSGYPYGEKLPTGYGTPSAQTPPPTSAQPPYYPYPQTQTAYPQTQTAYPGVGTGASGIPGGVASQTPTSPLAASPAGLGMVEQSYIENILRMNKDKEVTAYFTFEHAGGGETKIFNGHIEAAGRDHLILKDAKTNQRYLLPLIYLDYVVFQGVVAYSYPYRR